MTNEPTAESPQDDKTGIKKSLALAAAYGIGPFRKRVRLDAPLPYEPEESYTSFTIDVRPPEPVWNYGGKLEDKPVTLSKTYYPSSSYEIGPSSFRGYAKHLTTKNVGIFANMEAGRIMDSFNDASSEFSKRFDNGFTFNRNGMSYQIEFFKPYSYHTPSTVFTISSSDSPYMRILHQRPMTKQEAEYALDIVKAELEPYDLVRLRSHIDRLAANLPTETEPGKTTLESMGKNFFTDKEDGLDAAIFKKTFDPIANKTRAFYAADPAALRQKMKQFLGNLSKP